MPLDKPIYVQIRERSRCLGRLWIMGDLGYYLGLVGAVIAFAMLIAIPPVGGLASLLGDEEKFQWYWQLVPPSLMALPICILVTIVSGYIKAVVFRRSGLQNDVQNEPSTDES